MLYCLKKTFTKLKLLLSSDDAIWLYKCLVVIVLLMMFPLIFLRGTLTLFLFSILLIFIYSFFSICYFLYCNNKEDRKSLLKMLSIYYPIIGILFMIIFNFTNHILQVEKDRLLVKLNYEIQLGKKEQAQQTYQEYNKNILLYLNMFKPISEYEAQKVFLEEMESQDKPKDTTDMVYSYHNIFLILICQFTIFMFIWGFTSLRRS